MAKTHDPRKLLIDPNGGPVELVLTVSGGSLPEESDFLRPTLSHITETGNHIIKPVEKLRGMRRWETPAMFDTRIETEDELNIKLRQLSPPPPTVKFSLAIYVLSRSGVASVIYADLLVLQDGSPIYTLDSAKNPERFGGGLTPRIDYAANVELYLSHP